MDSDIYEIYRACRLCGLGAGYKMPIIQSILDLDEEVDLKQKIRECVQIEVNLNDRMPPLICELCVDKIQDFYEFRRLCQETNKKTRTRLGLPMKPLQTTCVPDPPVTRQDLNSDSDEAEPLSKQVTRKPGPKSAKVKAEAVKIKVTDTLLVQMRAALARHLGRARGDSDSGVDAPIVINESRSPSPEVRRDTRRKRASSPKRLTRHSVTEDTEVQDMPIPKTRAKPGPKSAIKAREKQKQEENETTRLDESEDSLLVPRQKRPREIQVETPLAAKRSKITTEPNKIEKTSRPGPKSSKTTPIPSPVPKPSPKAGPKSRKLDPPPPKSQKSETPAPKSKKPESQETPKSKKTDLTPSKIEVSKSKSRGEVSPMPGPKSRKETLPTPTSKIKTRDASLPGPKSKKQPEGPKAPEKVPKAPEKAPKAPEKAQEKAPKTSEKVSKASVLTCTICGSKAKAAQGLSSHMKTHAPNYTPPKMACNACELWFATAEAANYHHKRHTNMALPYTCAKCYDDFRTQDDYEMHFVRAQCIRTYEVPDVKCDECWKLFPTYKLMEEHRCQGEGGRPGGKCPNCNRSFVSQKGLTAHEIRCSVKKKVEPVTESAERITSITSGMLPMQVRVVRCDSLLTAQQGFYDVSRLGARFGLDRNCTYPYLSTDVKPVPATFDHMVDTKDEIKDEYMNQDGDDTFVHWDSNDENDDLDNTVDSLFTISLKTIFSEKCVGKVPRLKRKVKSEKGLDHLSIRTNIDLVKESCSDNYDSDSILDKNLERSDSANLFDIKIINAIENSDSVKEINMVNDGNEIIRNITENDLNDSLDKIKVDTNYVSDQSVKHHQENIEKDARNDLEVTNNSKTTLDEDTRSKSSLEHSEDTSKAIENDDHCRSLKNSGIVSEISLPNEEIEEGKVQVELENLYKIQESNREDTNKLTDASDVEMSEQTTEKSTASDKIDSNTNSQVSETSTYSTIDDFNVTKYDSLQEMDDKINKDCGSSCANGGSITATNDARDEKDKPNAIDIAYEANLHTATNDKANENDNSLYVKNELTNNANSANGDERNNYNEPSSEKELNSVTNDKTYENDDSSETIDATVNNASPENGSEDCSSKTEEVMKNIEEPIENHLIHSKESLITENELFENVSVQSVDKFNIHYLDDEDKILMAELDAQIGENTSPSNETGEKINEIGDNSEIIGDSNEIMCKNIEGMDGNSETVDENSEMISNNSAIIGEDPVIGEKIAIIADNAMIEEPSAIIDDALVKNSDAENDNFRNETVITNEGFTEEKNETLEILINKHNDLKSLDLDTVSDEEFDFNL